MGEHQHKTAPDLRVHYIVVSSVVLVNSATNLPTYADVPETLRVPDGAFGQVAPLQAHISLSGEGEYEVALTWVRGWGARGTSERHPAGETSVSVLLSGRTRSSAPNLKLPGRAGSYGLVVQWRRPGEGVWHDAPCIFYLDVEAVEALKPVVADEPVADENAN